MSVLLLLLALQAKHCLGDFWWQTPWMMRDKGLYGGRGGLVHAGFHAVMTLALLVLFRVPASLCVALAAAEFVVHYHIDWVKARAAAGSDPQSRAFWQLLGADQFAHQATYVAILAILQMTL